MEEDYMQPKMTVVELNPRITILAESIYGDGIEGTRIDDEPGGQEDFW